MGIGNKLAPVELASVLAFQDVTDNPPASAADFVYFRKGDILYQRTPAGVVSVVGAASNITGILGLDHGGTGADLSATTVNSTLAKLTNKVATGVSAVAFAVDNLIDLVTSGAKICSFRSAGTEKAAILGDGGVLAPTVGPSATQQHTLPAVASDSVALVAALQTFTGKSFGNLPMSAPPASTVAIGAVNFFGGIGTSIRNPAGDQLIIGNIGGSGTSQASGAWASFTLLTNGTKDISVGSQGGFATVADDLGNVVALFGFTRTAVTNTGGQTYTNFSTTLTTASKLNVNASGGLLRFENKTAGTLNLVVQFNFWQQP